VRAKQRLCFHVVFLPLACVLAVSPHVNSAVRFLSVKPNGNDWNSFCHKNNPRGVLSMMVLFWGNIL